MVLTFCVVMINNFASLTAVVGQVRREEGREGGREWGGEIDARFTRLFLILYFPILPLFSPSSSRRA